MYSSPNIIRILKSRRLRWAGHVARMELSRNAYRVLVGKRESKRPLGRPRRRNILGVKIEEITREWRKLLNPELHALYTSPNIIRNFKSRRLRWLWHVERIEGSRNAYRVLVGRTEGKISLGRPRRRWEDNR